MSENADAEKTVDDVNELLLRKEIVQILGHHEPMMTLQYVRMIKGGDDEQESKNLS